MKTQTYVLSSFLVCSTIMMNAQITLTQAANSPTPGTSDSKKELDSTNVLPKTAGASQTWDFTNAVTNSTNTTVYVTTYTTASSIPGSSMYTAAGANIATTDSAFFKSTSSSLEFIGSIGSDGSTMYLSNPAKLAQFPFTYGNSFTDTFSGTWTVTPTGVFNISGNISVTADAYGTVILPSTPNNISFSNVLRVKASYTQTIAGTGTLSTFSSTMITTEYAYFKSGSRYPFFQISYSKTTSSFGSNNSYSIFYDSNIPVGVELISAQNPMIMIFPNPTSDVINIQMNKGDYKHIKIMDIQGKLVKEKILTEKENEITLDIKDLSSGEYVLLLQSSSSGYNDVSYKFIKE